MSEGRLFAVDDDQGRSLALARDLAAASAGRHEPVEETRSGLRYVHCTCGHRGGPGVRWTDAYNAQFVHLLGLARPLGIAVPF